MTEKLPGLVWFELGTMALRMGSWITSKYELGMRRHRLSAARFQILLVLRVTGPKSRAELGRWLFLSRQGVHAAVHRLAKDGFLQFVPDTDRSVVEVTELGSEVAETTFREILDFVAETEPLDISDVDTAVEALRHFVSDILSRVPECEWELSPWFDMLGRFPADGDPFAD